MKGSKGSREVGKWKMMEEGLCLEIICGSALVG